MERSIFSRNSQAEDGIWGWLCPISGDSLEFLKVFGSVGREVEKL